MRLRLFILTPVFALATLAAVVAMTLACAPIIHAQYQPQAEAFPYEADLLTSGYYSPLPGQLRYVTGTYEGDLRLNGNGIVGADGTAVYAGMAAAPPEIAFGTKIAVPDVGVVAIHDRGGAIHNNRLDIWMGYGEDGLRRALAWGMRTVKVTVYAPGDSLAEGVNLDTLPQAQDVGFYAMRYFKNDLSFGNSGEAVTALQSYLDRLGFAAPQTGIFDEATQSAVLAFQKDQKIIDDERDVAAGYFGPRTRAALEAVLQKKRVEVRTAIPRSLQPGISGGAVTSLQNMLVQFGFLESGNVTGSYDEATTKAVLDLQIAYGIVTSPRELGAGYVGPKTRDTISQLAAASYDLPGTSSMEIVVAAENKVEGLIEGKFAVSLGKGDSGRDVIELQKELKRLNLFRTEESAKYGDVTANAVFKFQQIIGIVEKETDSGAGYFGPQTRSALHALIAKREETSQLIVAHTENYRIAVASKGRFQQDLATGSRGDDVQELQRSLKKLGFYEGNLITQYFGDVTKKSLSAFQKHHGLISSENDARAGTLDAQTREKLNGLL